MRASQLKAIVLGRITAITPPSGAAFTVIDQPRDPVSAAERSVRMTITSQPTRAEGYNICDTYACEWQLSEYFPWSAEAEDAIGADAELITEALRDEAVIELSADIQVVSVTPTGVDEIAGLLASRFRVVGVYRQDPSVTGASA